MNEIKCPICLGRGDIAHGDKSLHRCNKCNGSGIVQPLNAQAHAGDGNSAAKEAGVITLRERHACDADCHAGCDGSGPAL